MRKKRLFILSLSLFISFFSMSNDKLDIKDYEIVGLTDYLEEDDINSINNLLFNEIGLKSKEDIKNTVNNLKLYFDKKYGNKYDVIENGINSEGIYTLEIVSKLANIEYIEGKSNFENIDLPSIKKGINVSEIDKRDLQILEENPQRNTKFIYKLDKEGKLNLSIYELSEKEKYNKFFIDNYGINGEMYKVRIGYNYKNSNLFGFDDHISLTAALLNERSYYLGAKYVLPYPKYHSIVELNGSYSNLDILIKRPSRLKGHSFDFDARYSYFIPIDMKEYKNKYKLYLGGKHSLTNDIVKFNGEEVSRNEKYSFIPYAGLSFYTEGDKYIYSMDASIEGAVKDVLNNLQTNYFKFTGEMDLNYLITNNISYKSNLKFISVNDGIKDKNLGIQIMKNIRSREDNEKNYSATKALFFKNDLEFGNNSRLYIFNDFAYGLIPNKDEHILDTLGLGFKYYGDTYRLDTNIAYDVFNLDPKSKNKFSFNFYLEANF